MHLMADMNRSACIRLLLATLLSVQLFLSACAPAVGYSTVNYGGSSGEILGAIARFAPQVRPGSAFNRLHVEARGADFITLSATQTMGSQVVSALAQSMLTTVYVTVTVRPLQARLTEVTVGAAPAGTAVARRTAERITVELERRFRPATIGF